MRWQPISRADSLKPPPQIHDRVVQMIRPVTKVEQDLLHCSSSAFKTIGKMYMEADMLSVQCSGAIPRPARNSYPKPDVLICSVARFRAAVWYKCIELDLGISGVLSMLCFYRSLS
jgi:hypothetical protein